MAWKRFLVSGAAGFIGASLVRRLLERGSDVTVLVGEGADLWRLREVVSRLRVVRGDVSDPVVAQRAVAEGMPDAVFHLAAYGGSESQSDAARILKTNVMGTWTMLSACASSPCRLFVHTGSSSEYGFKKDPMRETDRLEPNSIYAVGKAAATHLCSYFASRSPFAIVTCRLFSVYGPWEQPTRLIPTLLRRCLENQPLEMVPRNTARDFVFVDDVIEALLHFEELDKLSGEVLNLGTGRQVTMEDIVSLTLELTGSSSEVRWGAMAPRIWDSSVWVADCEKARRKLAWQTTYTLRAGLALTLEWMKERKQEAER